MKKTNDGRDEDTVGAGGDTFDKVAWSHLWKGKFELELEWQDRFSHRKKVSEVEPPLGEGESGKKGAGRGRQAKPWRDLELAFHLVMWVTEKFSASKQYNWFTFLKDHSGC